MGVFNRDRTVNAFEVDPDDPMFLRPEEHTFIFFGASLSIVRMLSGKKENYTAGTIGFREVGLRPTDLIGKRCSASKKMVEEIHTACVGIYQNHVKYLFLESEFSAWFAAQDKEKLKPYRFVRPRKRTLIVEGSSFKIQVNNGEKLDEYSFEGLADIPYSAVAAMASGESRVETAARPDPGGLASLVAAPSLVSASRTSAETGMDSGWRAPDSAGMSEVRDQAVAAAAGMTMAGEAVIPHSGGGGAGPSMTTGAGFSSGSATTQTVVVCPHCAHPIMFSFQASKIGGQD